MQQPSAQMIPTSVSSETKSGESSTAPPQPPAAVTDARLIPTSEVATLTGHTSTVNCCAVFGEGRWAISGSNDRTLKVWDLETNTVIATLTGHTRGVNCCAVFAEGRRAISGSYDRTLKVWDLETNTVIATLTGHIVNCCTITSACNNVFKEQNASLMYAVLVVGSSRTTSSSSSGGKGAGSVSSYPTTDEPKLCISDGKTVEGSATAEAVSSGDTTQQQQPYRSINFRSVCRLSNVTRLIFAFARESDADGRRAISGGQDRTFKVWDLETYAEIASIETGHRVLCCDVFADGTPRVLTGGGKGANGKYDLKVWR